MPEVVRQMAHLQVVRTNPLLPASPAIAPRNRSATTQTLCRPALQSRRHRDSITGGGNAQPAAQLAFFLGALTLGCPYLRVVIEEFRHPPDPAEISFRPDFIDGDISTWEQLAIGINLPPCWLAWIAIAIAAPFLPSLADSGRVSELAQHALQSIAIPIFWYWLGARLDRRTAARRRHPRILEIIAWLLAIAVASILPLSTLSGHNPAMPILTCFAAAWLACAALALRKCRRQLEPSLTADTSEENH